MKYDVIIVGAGPGGIFTAYELLEKNADLKIAVFEAGHALERRRCPIDGDKVKSCIRCKSCAIIRNIIFSIRKSTCTAKSVHYGTGLTSYT